MPPKPADKPVELGPDGLPLHVDPRAKWSPARRALYDFLYHDLTEQSLGLVIAVNLVLVIIESNFTADEATHENLLEPYPGFGDDAIQRMRQNVEPSFVEMVNSILLCVYTVELCTRLFVLQGKFFFDPWCVMDFLIVGSDLVLAILDLLMGDMPKLAVLRVCRLMRLARAFKALSKFPELALLLRGFACAFKAIFWGILLVLIVLTIWSILAVQLVHPINIRVANKGEYEGCDRCPRAFSSVWNSLVTFTQQLVAGDSWGTVSLPIIEENWLVFYFFLAVLVSVSLAIMNLILAVIVDSATEARTQTLAGVQALKEAEFQKATEHFTELCKELDADGGGFLTAEELISGFDTSEEFTETMSLMGLRRDDMQVVFNVIDRDNSGEINYQEFVTEMNIMRSADMHTMLQFIQFYVTDVQSAARRICDVVSPSADLASAQPSQGAAPARASKRMLRNVSPSTAEVNPTGTWEPLTHGGAVPLFSAQASATGQGQGMAGTSDALTELKRVNQELVFVMKQMVERTEAHTRILTSLGSALPNMQGNPWLPLEGVTGGDQKGVLSAFASLPGGGAGKGFKDDGGFKDDVKGRPERLPGKSAL